MNIKQVARYTFLGVTIALMTPAIASEELSAKNNCAACHTVDKKVLGPSFKDIAEKYRDDPAAVEMLVEKVQKGGTGNWGNIPMPPNPLVSDEDAKTLVEWVLSL